jgi:hypothetical protein
MNGGPRFEGAQASPKAAPSDPKRQHGLGGGGVVVCSGQSCGARGARAGHCGDFCGDGASPAEGLAVAAASSSWKQLSTWSSTAEIRGSRGVGGGNSSCAEVSNGDRGLAEVRAAADFDEHPSSCASAIFRLRTIPQDPLSSAQIAEFEPGLMLLNLSSPCLVSKSKEFVPDHSNRRDGVASSISKWFGRPFSAISEVMKIISYDMVSTFTFNLIDWAIY